MFDYNYKVAWYQEWQSCLGKILFKKLFPEGRPSGTWHIL